MTVFGPFALLLALIVGASLAAAAQQAVLALRLRNGLEALYAVGLLSAALTVVCALGYHSTRDVTAFRAWYQAHALLSRPIFLAWAIFVLQYSGFRSPWPARIYLGAEGLKALLLLAFIRTPYFINIQSLRPEALPWGEVISYPVGPAGALAWIQVLVPVIALTIGLAGSWRLWRLRQRDEALFLALCVSSAIGSMLVENLCDRLGWGHLPLVEVVVLVPVLAMTWHTSRRMVKAHKTQQALSDREVRLRAMLRGMSEGVLGVDPQGRVNWLNPVAVELLGEAALRAPGQPLSNLLGEALLQEAAQRPQAPLRLPGTGRLVTLHHTPLESDTGRPLGSLYVLRDRTRTVALEEELRQNQKMQAIGLLAAGIAHDFNNLLATIQMSAELLAEQPQPPPEAAQISAACDRGADLTRKLLAVGRKAPFEPRPLGLNRLLDGVSDLLRKTLGRQVELVTRLEAAHDTVLADAGALQSVIINLAVNARDAMPAGGRLEIATSEDAAAGQVLIRVSDNGAGIPYADQLRVFEPYFTTKAVGKGSGLGLAMVFSTMEAHQGRISLWSEPGKGTAFTLSLPLHPGDPEGAFAPAQGGRAALRLLLVDDEPELLTLLARSMQQAGHQVRSAYSAAEALAALQQQPFDAAIFDVQMPHMDGLLLLQAARKLHPGLPVLLHTGQADEAVLQAAKALGRVAVMHKPASRERLLSALAELTS